MVCSSPDSGAQTQGPASSSGKAASAATKLPTNMVILLAAGGAGLLLAASVAVAILKRAGRLCFGPRRQQGDVERGLQASAQTTLLTAVWQSLASAMGQGGHSGGGSSHWAEGGRQQERPGEGLPLPSSPMPPTRREPPEPSNSVSLLGRLATTRRRLLAALFAGRNWGQQEVSTKGSPYRCDSPPLRRSMDRTPVTETGGWRHAATRAVAGVAKAKRVLRLGSEPAGPEPTDLEGKGSGILASFPGIRLHQGGSLPTLPHQASGSNSRRRMRHGRGSHVTRGSCHVGRSSGAAGATSLDGVHEPPRGRRCRTHRPTAPAAATTNTMSSGQGTAARAGLGRLRLPGARGSRTLATTSPAPSLAIRTKGTSTRFTTRPTRRHAAGTPTTTQRYPPTPTRRDRAHACTPVQLRFTHSPFRLSPFPSFFGQGAATLACSRYWCYLGGGGHPSHDEGTVDSRAHVQGP